MPVASPSEPFEATAHCNENATTKAREHEVANNLVVLPTRVNGSQELPFILDTGASATVIDRRQAENLGLSITRGADVSTGGGDVEASRINGVTLKIGDLSLPDLNVIAIDLAGLSAGLGRPVAGILGGKTGALTLLREYVDDATVHIELRTRRLL
jgi:predicted aspartyl protease